MAPLPENNTIRVWLDYTSTGRAHSLLLRLPSDALRSEAEALAAAVAPVLAQRMLDTDSVLSARWSEAGSNISLPIDFTPVPGVVTGALVVWQEDPESAFLSLPFRDQVAGRKGFYGFFSPVRTVGWPGNNRYEPGDESVIDTFRLNFRNIVEGFTPSVPATVSIAGWGVRLQPYVNISKNAYWERKQRRGG